MEALPSSPRAWYNDWMETIVLPDRERLAELCRRWKIRNLFLFGSVARGEARPDSDVDLLVEFEAESNPGYPKLFRMRDAFEALFGRKVDLVEERLIRGERRRRSILKDKTQLYAA